MCQSLACVNQVVPGANVDGVMFSVTQFSFDPKTSVKGESPWTCVQGVVSQIFESEMGFDGAKWPLFPNFESTGLQPGSIIPSGSVGIKNGRAKIMAMLLVCEALMCGSESAVCNIEVLKPALMTVTKLQSNVRWATSKAETRAHFRPRWLLCAHGVGHCTHIVKHSTAASVS